MYLVIILFTLVKKKHVKCSFVTNLVMLFIFVRLVNMANW